MMVETGQGAREIKGLLFNEDRVLVLQSEKPLRINVQQCKYIVQTEVYFLVEFFLFVFFLFFLGSGLLLCLVLFLMLEINQDVTQARHLPPCYIPGTTTRVSHKHHQE